MRSNPARTLIYPVLRCWKSVWSLRSRTAVKAPHPRDYFTREESGVKREIARQSREKPAAIHYDGLSMDKIGPIGGEKHRDCTDVARLANAPSRHSSLDIGLPPVGTPNILGHVGLDQAGRDGIHADSLARPFDREQLGQTDQGVL